MIATTKSAKLIDSQNIDESKFRFRYVSCIVLTRNHKILLQQRGNDWQRFPGYLAHSLSLD
jgi:hypothetical protein